MLPSRSGILAKAISKTAATTITLTATTPTSPNKIPDFMSINTSPLPRFHMLSSHTSSITIPLSPSISPRTYLPPDVAGTPTIGTLGGAPTVPTTAQRSYNHLAILRHNYSNNKHNNNDDDDDDDDDNNNNNNNNTVSSPHSNRSSILCQNFVSNSPGFYFSAIYLSKN